MANYKLSIKREVAKRMLNKNFDLDYVKEISGLSKKNVKSLNRLNNSFIGLNDLFLRKEYASKHHLFNNYYFKDRTTYVMGVDLNKSDFYKNKYIQKRNEYFIETINEIENQIRNDLRFKILRNCIDYLKDYKDMLGILFNFTDLKNQYEKNTDLYINSSYKIKSIEEEKIILELLSVENNLKKIAFIMELSDKKIESVVDKNSIFFSKGKLDKSKFDKELSLWESELKYEIAQRSTTGYPDIEINSKILGLNKNYLKYIFENYYHKEGKHYILRKNIAKKLMEDFLTIQEISEISGLSTFHIEQIADENYYNGLFSKYYDEHGDKKLIINNTSWSF